MAIQGAGLRAHLDLQTALAQSEQLAATDPVAAQQFLVLRKRQIAEIRDLQAEADASTAASTKQLLEQQIALLRQAHGRELTQLQQQTAARADELATLGDAGAETGQALVDGILAALNAAGGTLSAALTAALEAALANAQHALGIRSPSTVAAELVGVPLAEGVGDGFATSMPLVASAMGSELRGLLGSTIRPPDTAAASRGSTYVGPTVSTTINGTGLSEGQLERMMERVAQRVLGQGAARGRALGRL
jgi:hypothetical protein